MGRETESLDCKGKIAKDTIADNESLMRPQQQGRRSRNRGGGRRSQNPLQRSYESNGPDVKIRGNAQVIADKYATLARDAQSSGDSVMAENYLQHAEHYNRIILAAQPQPRDGDDDTDQPSVRDGGDASGAADGDQQPGRRGRDERGRGNGRTEAASEGNGKAEARPEADDRSEAASNGNGKSGAGKKERKVDPDGDQPVIEGMPAEAREEQAEQSGKPKRAARPRKPRKKAEATAEEAPENADGADSETAGDAQERPVAAE